METYTKQVVKPTKTTEETVKISFPNVLTVAKNIAYDNGMVNRFESEEEYLSKVIEIISHRPIIELIKLEAWLATKNAIQLNIIAVGEESLMADIMEDCPDAEFANTLFEEFFES